MSRPPGAVVPSRHPHDLEGNEVRESSRAVGSAAPAVFGEGLIDRGTEQERQGLLQNGLSPVGNHPSRGGRRREVGCCEPHRGPRLSRPKLF